MKYLFLSLVYLFLFSSPALCGDWPKTELQPSAFLAIGPVEIQVPAGWKGAYVFSDLIHKIQYDGYSVAVTVYYVEDIEILKDVFPKSKYTLNDFPSLVIDATPQDTSPSDPNDKRVWEEALATKRMWFRGAEGKILREGNRLAYTGRVNYSGFKSSTILAYKDKPFILHVLGTETPDNVIAGIISSFMIREGI